MRSVFDLYKFASAKIKIVTIYNLISIIVSIITLFLAISLLHNLTDKVGLVIETLIFSAFVLIGNYFLLKKEKAAFYLMLLWYALLSLNILKYGLYFSVSYGTFKINFLKIAMFIILLSAKRDFSTKK